MGSTPADFESFSNTEHSLVYARDHSDGALLVPQQLPTTPSLGSMAGSGTITPNCSDAKDGGFAGLVQDAEVKAETSEAGRDGTIKSSVFNLVSTVIGGGVLSLPYTCHRAGLIVAPIILALVALMSSYSALLLISCARRVTKRKRGEAVNRTAESYEDVVFAAFGSWAKHTVNFLIFLLTFLALIAYFILLADLLVPVMKLALKSSVNWVCTATEKEQRLWVIIMCASVITLPSLLKDITALKYTSIVSVTSISVLGVGVVIKAIQSSMGEDGPQYYNIPQSGDVPISPIIPHIIPSETQGMGVVYFPSSIGGVLESVSIMACAFMCHFNVLPLHTALQEPTRKRLKVMIYVTIAAVWSFYAIVSIFGYLEFRGSVCDNLLKNYDHRRFSFIMVGQIGLSMTLLFSMPLLTHPCRSSFEALVSKTGHPYHIRVLSILVIVATTAAIGSQIKSIVTVWNFLGSTVSIMIGYIFPAASYLRLRDPEDTTATFVGKHGAARLMETDSLTLALTESQEPSTRRRGLTEDLNKHRLPAFILLVVGFVLMFACTTQAVISTTKTSSHSFCPDPKLLQATCNPAGYGNGTHHNGTHHNGSHHNGSSWQQFNSSWQI